MSFLPKFSLGGGLENMLKGSKSNSKGELQNLIRDMLNVQRESYPVQESYLRRAANAQNEGYNSALLDVNRAEGLGMRDIGYAGQAGMQAARGAAASRGLTGSSGGTNLAMASARDTRRAYSDLQTNLARQRSGLRIAQGQAKSAGLGSLANFQAYKANSINNVLMPYFQHQSTKLLQKQGASGANLGGFGQLAGMAIGGAFGGPAGAGIGGTLGGAATKAKANPSYYLGGSNIGYASGY